MLREPGSTETRMDQSISGRCQTRVYTEHMSSIEKVVNQHSRAGQERSNNRSRPMRIACLYLPCYPVQHEVRVASHLAGRSFAVSARAMDA